MASSTQFANNVLTLVPNGNLGIGIGNTSMSDQLVIGGNTEVQGSILCDTIVETGPFTPLTPETQGGFKSWVKDVSDEAKENWWATSTTPMLNKSADVVANQAPVVEYLFGSLGDTGTNAQTLTLTTTTGATQNIAVQNNDSTVGNYLRVDNSTTTGLVAASAPITTSGAELISGGNGTGSGLTMSFDIKWDTATGGVGGTGGEAYYCIGIGQSLTTTISRTPGTVANATGIAIGTDTQQKNAYLMYIDSSGNYESHNHLFSTSSDFFSTSWRHIDIVISPTAIQNVLLYVNGQFLRNTSLGAPGASNTQTASFSLAASSATRTHFAAKGSDAFRVANFRLWKRPLSAAELANNYNMTSSIFRTPDVEYLFSNLNDTGKNATTLTLATTTGAGQNIAVQTGDPEKGNYLRVDNSTDTGLVSASAAIATGSTAELIAGGNGTGSGLTMSFDIKWDNIGDGLAYYMIGIGQGISSMSSWTENSFNTTVANTIVIGKWIDNGVSKLFIKFADNVGGKMNFGVFNSDILTTTSWNHVDIVFLPSLITPDLYINGAFDGNLVMAFLGGGSNSVATSFSLAANSATRTHFAAKGSDAYRVANFRLWRRPLSADELASNYAASPRLLYNPPITPAYKGSTLLPDGRVLFVPNGATSMYMYNPSMNTFTNGLAATGYNGGVLLPDGRVVLVPDSATAIGLYEPNSNTITNNTITVRENPRFTSVNTVADDYFTTYKWNTDIGWEITSSGGATGHGPSEYKLFSKSSAISSYHNFTSTSSWVALKFPEPVIISSFSVQNRWNSRYIKNFTVQGSINGSSWTTIYTGANITAWNVNLTQTFTISDPIKNGLFSYFRLNSTGFDGSDAEVNQIIVYTLPVITKYAGGVFLPNGNVLFVPSDAATIGLYTPYATVPALTAGAALPEGVASSLPSKYSGGVLLADGRVLLVPNAATRLQLYDYVTNTFNTTVSALLATGYSGGVLLPDGRVLLVPKTATTIKIFDPVYNIIEDSVALTGYDSGVLMPDGRVMLVPNSASDVAYFNPVVSSLIVNSMGALDRLGIYSTAVGCYAFKRLFKEYTGAQIRLRRSTTEEADVWFSNTGAVVKYQPIVSGASGSMVLTNSLSAWINGAASVFISIWYDQSVGAKHLRQTTAASQPLFEYDKLLDGFGVRFSGAQTMTAGNLFGADSVTNMQGIMRIREVVSTNNLALSFNGGTSYIHAPWSDRRWYWDPNNNIDTRSVSEASITQVGAVSQVSIYISGMSHGLSVNSFKYTNTSLSALNVSSGLQIGGAVGLFYNGFFQYLITLSTKTTDANTQAVFDILKDNTNNYNGGTLIPDGRIVMAPAGANNIGVVTGLPTLPIERCIHPCFNKF